MCWSPDQELVVVISGVDMLMLMTRNFDPLVEVPLSVNDFGEAKPISVGWGSTETQFRGQAGKMGAVSKSDTTNTSLINADDDMIPRTSWRGDGEYFVTSSVDHAVNTRRTLRVWSRDGTLQSTSEEVAGLGHALAWRPSGNWIARYLFIIIIL